MLGRKVPPRECALALAVPLTEAQFEEDRSSVSKKEFAKLLKRIKRGDKILSAFERYQSDVIEPLGRVTASVAAAGVAVYQRVELHQIQSICRAHSQITLVAHCEYLLMPPQDILDLSAFHSLLNAAIVAEQQAPPTNEKSLATLLNVPDVRAAQTKEQLSEALSHFLNQGAQYYFPEDTDDKNPLPPPRKALATFDRLVLEDQFPGCFSDGALIELTDGLCSAAQFIAQIPEDYDGLIDLILCRSIILAQLIRKRRPMCNAICAVWPATFDTRLAIYETIIEELDKTPRPYEDVGAEVHEALIQEMRRQNKKTNPKSSQPS